MQDAPENVWYHYFDIRDNTGQKSTFRGFLLSLLIRAGANSMGIHPALKHFFDKCNKQGLTGSSPTIKDLVIILKEIFETISGGYIILDAMDECNEPSEVLEWLQNLPKQFYILFTSRYTPVGNFLRDCLIISLASWQAEVDEDIEKYLEEKMKRYDFGEALRVEVISTLKKKAQGQFRWVDCQLRALDNCGGIPRVVHEALADLPEDLEQTYNQAMEWTLNQKKKQEKMHIIFSCGCSIPLNP
ncbi:hypothetical protein GYMLUDRAFT_906423 [Collybiopsis luxurians FD-317 M1]|uniref:Nephrocystin 3-like N-terminal domain-containing protein n=1 Tax=Collybiopsis luxurians FD-317 M1 TaxID=944289 RepID=A0A0D0C8L1_9AGAR|nr:hypothetical protein GYMLUDRAFT_906423 [Collybiopsis luxurians FD-317 M1]